MHAVSDDGRSPSSEQATAVLNRLKRAQGQLNGVLRMVEERRDLGANITQLKAVSCALERAGFAMVAGELRSAAVAGELDAKMDDLEKHFLGLR